MKILKRIFTAFISLGILTSTVFAQEGTNYSTYKAIINESDSYVQETELVNDIDNSELDVRVVKQTDDGQITIFEGKLKDYDNGAWIYTDFSDIQCFVIFNWDSNEDEALYIIPMSIELEIENDANISTPSDKSIKEVLSNGISLTSQNSDIRCDVNLMYDGAYSERVIFCNKQLNVPVKITNTGSLSKNIVCYIAEYDENGVLRNTIAGSAVTVGAKQSVATQVTKVFSADTKTVKIFVWDSETLQPLTLDGHQDIITTSGEFALFSFTPDKTGAYIFKVSNYNGGTTAYDTYIKLYDNISMTKRLGNDENKIVANLKAGHTYYLQFSGFLTKWH